MADQVSGATVTQSREPVTVAIVGGGPRGVGVLERLVANVRDVLGSRPLHVDVIDPYPAGGGQVWRAAQSSLMLMNVTAENVTMFTDASVRCEGPIREGPSLSEWVATRRDVVHPLGGKQFASRQTMGRYLDWMLREILAGLPSEITVTVHQDRVVRLERTGTGGQRVWLADGETSLAADVVVLTLGHPDSVADHEGIRMTDFARRHGLTYVPPSYTADLDLSALRPGQEVAVRGLGLAFVDLMALLTEGRGGRYQERSDGSLRYAPSGCEPTLVVGSRRGVPYRAKLDYGFPGAEPPLPRFFDPAAVRRRVGRRRRLDFVRDLFPLMVKEIAWGHYHELFASHPDRVDVGWDRFARRYAAADWNSAEMDALIREAVPAAEDRWDYGRVARPLEDLPVGDPDAVHAAVTRHLAADVARRGDPWFSADLGAFSAMLSVRAELAAVLAERRLAARSQVVDLAGWWMSFYEYYASGPPISRLRQMLALAEAGIVRFVGPGALVSADPADGLFHMTGAHLHGSIATTALVDARLPQASLRRNIDPLVRSILEDGTASTAVLTGSRGYRHDTDVLNVSDRDFRIVDRAGRVQPDRFAIGPYTTVTHFATFARPRSNALSMRQNDALARHVLGYLAVTDGSPIGQARRPGAGIRAHRRR